MTDDNTSDVILDENNPRLTALRELFHRENHTVRSDCALADYRIEITDGCLHDHRVNALSILGFKLGSVHAHIRYDYQDSGEDVTEIHANITDKRQ